MKTAVILALVILSAASGAWTANLLTNAGFETGDPGTPPDPASWTEYGPDLTGERSYTYHQSGSYSAKRWTGADFQEYGYYQSFPISPGEEYRCSAYLFSPANDALSGSGYAVIRIEFYSAANALLLQRESPRLRGPNGVFRLYTVQAVAPAGGSYARFVYGVGGGASPHLGAAYCDDAVAEQIGSLSQSDEEFLNDVQRRAFDFFWNETSPLGLVKDRAGIFAQDSYAASSIASVGFGLAAICIGVDRGWVDRQSAWTRIHQTLLTFRDTLVNDNGFFYHFNNMNTGQPTPGSEVSTIDTALFLFGALFAGEHFESVYGDPSLKPIAESIYNRVNWPAKYNGWSTYSEYIMMDLLAIGSPTHPISPSVWNSINRNYQDALATRTADHTYQRFFYPALFVHQYPQCFIDLNIRRDAHTQALTYFESSRNNTRSNRQYCIDHSLSNGIALPKYQTYGPDCWGLTAGDGPDGYEAFGEAEPNLPEPQGTRGLDGTVLPHAPGGSVMFAPDICIPALRYMRATYGSKIWGKYGFSDSFNVDRNWWATDVIGIDLGAVILSIENYRTGRPWRTFMQNGSIRRGLQLSGFTEQYPPHVDNFESGPPTVWGGSCGEVWGTGSLSYVSVPSFSAWVGGRALRVATVEPGGGASICLNALNLCYDDLVTFWIRGEAGGETPEMRLTDTDGGQSSVPLGPYVTGGQITTDWQQVSIPLTVFAGVRLTSSATIGLQLDGASSAVLVDSLGFLGNHPDAGRLSAASIGSAESLPEGTPFSLPDLIVSENFGSFIYAQQTDRAAGIKVSGAFAFTPGDTAALRGKIRTIDGEKTFLPDSALKTGHGAGPRPLGVLAGLIGTTLPDVTGLRVVSWGVAGNASGDEFPLSDALGRAVIVSAPASPLPAPGTLVKVTGEAGRQGVTGMPVLRVRSWVDIVTLY